MPAETVARESLGVVHIVQHPHIAGVPTDLRVSERQSNPVWNMIATFVAIVAYIAVVIALWTFATPNGWAIPINIFWTIVLGFFSYCAVKGLQDSRTESTRGTDMQSRWRSSLPDVHAKQATVVSRDASTDDFGSVVRIELTVQSDDGTVFQGEWVPHTRPDGTAKVLQPQIPGVGSSVTVWCLPSGTADDPYVIEYVDPSVIQHGTATLERVYL